MVRVLLSASTMLSKDDVREHLGASQVPELDQGLAEDYARKLDDAIDGLKSRLKRVRPEESKQGLVGEAELDDWGARMRVFGSRDRDCYDHVEILIPTFPSPLMPEALQRELSVRNFATVRAALEILEPKAREGGFTTRRDDPAIRFVEERTPIFGVGSCMNRDEYLAIVFREATATAGVLTGSRRQAARRRIAARTST